MLLKTITLPNRSTPVLILGRLVKNSERGLLFRRGLLFEFSCRQEKCYAIKRGWAWNSWQENIFLNPWAWCELCKGLQNCLTCTLLQRSEFIAIMTDRFYTFSKINQFFFLCIFCFCINAVESEKLFFLTECGKRLQPQYSGVRCLIFFLRLLTILTVVQVFTQRRRIFLGSWWMFPPHLHLVGVGLMIFLCGFGFTKKVFGGSKKGKTLKQLCFGEDWI